MKKQLVCKTCGTFKIRKKDLKHYRHDVDGNNVYVECPGCKQPVSCYKEAVEFGWVEPDQL